MSVLDNLRSLLEKGQDTALLRYSIGTELLKLDRFDEAVDAFQCAVKLDPEYSAAWKMLGKALAADGRHSAAVKAFSDGIVVAERKGDIQAAKEMTVFRKRSVKALEESG